MMDIFNIKSYLHETLITAHNLMRGYLDFYKFPFDVNKPLSPKAYEVLSTGCRILESLHIPYFICDGTILGIIRDGNFIIHDNDIDVAVAVDVKADEVIAAFKEKGYKVGRRVYYFGKLQQLIFYTDSHDIFDICFWRPSKDGYHYHFVPEVKNGRRQDSKYFAAPESIVFKGGVYSTHPQIKNWLEEHYGSDWTIPKSSKGDWRMDVKDIV